MAKIVRKNAKIFGETATSSGVDPQIGQFGSAKIGTYTGTGDIETIQGLTAWSNGWIDAVTATQQFPTLPEMTGVHKVLSYQIAYILQQGKNIEWNASTTYYKGSGCCLINGTTVTHYTSLTDDNIGNNPSSDSVNWTVEASKEWAEKDLSNVTKPYVTTYYENGTSGYMIYSNKYCVQWGTWSGTIGGYDQHSVSLLQTYASTNFNIKVTSTPADYITGAGVSSTSSFTHASRYYDDDLGGQRTSATIYWTAQGYLP